jgi:hypothetical protein
MERYRRASPPHYRKATIEGGVGEFRKAVETAKDNHIGTEGITKQALKSPTRVQRQAIYQGYCPKGIECNSG